MNFYLYCIIYVAVYSKADGMIAKFANSASYNLKENASLNSMQKKQPDFSIIKNPVMSNVVLLQQKTLTEDAGFVISVFDLLSRELFFSRYVENAINIQISLPASFSDGMYQIRIIGRNGFQSLKFIRISNF